MTSYGQLGIIGFDFIEFAVQDIHQSAQPFLKLGFEKSASRHIPRRQLRSHLLTQNAIRIVLSQSSSTEDPIYQYVADHGEGIQNVGFLVQDAITALETSVERGALALGPPRKHIRDYGNVQTTTIQGFGDVRHTFISRKGTFFNEGFELSFRSMNRGYGLDCIHAFSAGIEKGNLDSWTEYYQKIWGLEKVETPSLVTSDKVYELASSDGSIRVFGCEPQESTSPLQKFVETNHGSGIFSLSLESKEIQAALSLLKQESIDLSKELDVEGRETYRMPSLVGMTYLKILQIGGLANGESR